jgi:indolepyruvate ferredoxin oxidoreductase
VERATSEPDPERRELSEIERELLTVAVDGEDGELRRLVEIRVPELVEYQSAAYARLYAETVRRVQVAEQERVPGHGELAEAVARNLFKLMAYKDEYEVARLQLDSFEGAKLRRELGADARVWFNLHPPLLRALGLQRKLKLGRWFVPALRVLRSMRRLRGTPLDPFGLARVRRVERKLVREYGQIVSEAIAQLTPETHPIAVELCELPDLVRGYEGIKLRNVVLYRKRVEALRRRLGARAGAQPTPSLR